MSLHSRLTLLNTLIGHVGREVGRTRQAAVLVDAGVKLWPLIDRAKEAAKAIREGIAESVGTEPGHYKVHGAETDAVAEVHVAEPYPVVRPDVSPAALRAELGPLYDLLFVDRVTVVPSPLFKQEVAALDPATREKVLAVVDIQQSRPRVSFRSN